MMDQLRNGLIITKDNFPAIRSTPSYSRSYVIWLVFGIVFLMLITLFYVIPILFYLEGKLSLEQLIAYGILYYPTIIWLSFRLALGIISRRGNAIRHVIVNREGVFYEKINGEIESIKYKQLGRSNGTSRYDVYSKIAHRRGPSLLKIFIKGAKIAVHFDSDAGYSYAIGNRALLRSHFIHGIKLFRPDLRIAESVYSEFYIDPETYTFDKKSYWTTIVLVALLLIIILLCIERYMSYRFGA